MSQDRNWRPVVSWIAQLVVAGTLLQTLFFKFTGAPEAVFIFSTLGVEPWGRLATGVVELFAGVLLLVPRSAPFGALIAAVVAVGAIGSHLALLGIEVRDDGGLLFGLAWLVLAGSVAVLALRRHEWSLPPRRPCSR
jgi:uncharacterized membrane protein YphA (DoxX/SURF4 family)